MDIKLSRQINGENALVHDIYIENGSPALVTQLESIQQHLKVRLLMFKGEWFINREEGVPYFQTVFEKGTPVGVVREIYRRAIATTPGIVAIRRLEVSVDSATRVGSVSFQATTDLGQILTVGFGEFVIELTA